MNAHSFFDMIKKNNKKELILNAAVKVFAGKGFYNANVADVAREAGVADGTIYIYFKNKDDLLISLFETKMEKILARRALQYHSRPGHHPAAKTDKIYSFTF